MPRSPNYRFERQERETVMAAKKEAKAEAKRPMSVEAQGQPAADAASADKDG